MTAIIARHSLALSRRILHVAPKTIRGKVLAYLSDMSERAGTREFDIPFDRQQLGKQGESRAKMTVLAGLAHCEHAVFHGLKHDG